MDEMNEIEWNSNGINIIFYYTILPKDLSKTVRLTTPPGFVYYESTLEDTGL